MSKKLIIITLSLHLLKAIFDLLWISTERNNTFLWKISPEQYFFAVFVIIINSDDRQSWIFTKPIPLWNWVYYLLSYLYICLNLYHLNIIESMAIFFFGMAIKKTKTDILWLSQNSHLHKSVILILDFTSIFLKFRSIEAELRLSRVQKKT